MGVVDGLLKIPWSGTDPILIERGFREIVRYLSLLQGVDIPDDEYFHLPGRPGGQIGYGGSGSGDNLELHSNPLDDGFIDFGCGCRFCEDDTTIISGQDIDFSPAATLLAGGGGVVHNVLNIAPTVDVETTVFIYSDVLANGKFNQKASDLFSSFIGINAIPELYSEDATYNPLSCALFRAAPETSCRAAGDVGTVPLVTGLLFTPNTDSRLDGSDMRITNITAVDCAPTYQTRHANAAFTVDSIRGLWLKNPAKQLAGSDLGTETYTDYMGVDMEDLTKPVNAYTVRSFLAPSATHWFLFNPGGARSFLDGDLLFREIDDTIRIGSADAGYMDYFAPTAHRFDSPIEAPAISNSVAALLVNDDAAQDVSLFGSAASGETPSLSVSGFFAGDALRTVTQGISAAETYLFHGANRYILKGDGGLRVEEEGNIRAYIFIPPVGGGHGVFGSSNTGGFDLVVRDDRNIFYASETEGIIFNNDGRVVHDFRVRGDTKTHLFFIDAGTQRVGIDNATPLASLDVIGTTRFGDSTTNYTETEADGTVKFNGAAKVWDDIQFDTDSGKVPAANAPTWEALTPNTSAFAFTLDDYKDLKANEYGHAYKEGEIAHMHAHVTIKTAQATGADRFVKLQVWVAYVDRTASAWAEVNLSAELTIPTGSTTLQIFYLDLGDVDLSGYAIETQIKARIKRIAATGGTEYADDVYITQVGAHLPKDTGGSRTENAK